MTSLVAGRRSGCLSVILSLAAFVWAVCGGAMAQEFPVRPLHFILPSAGGGTDIVTRLLGTYLSETLGQQVVVDNRPGGNGMEIGRAHV